MSSIRHRVIARDVKVGDTLITKAGSPTVSRTMPTKKGDKVQVFHGSGQPLVLEADAPVWITRAPVSQAPTR